MTIKVETMRTRRGGTAANQFIIRHDAVTYFQSYDVIVARRSALGDVTLDPRYWDYSVTTLRYLSQFLGMGKRDIQARINSGEYSLEELN